MESLTSGSTTSAGSFRCEHCDYVVTLADPDALPTCPGCGGQDFDRVSAFAGRRFVRPERGAPDPSEQATVLAEALSLTEAAAGQWLAWTDGDRVRVLALDREWTRIGRSLAADVRFDDPTVSRRHALIVRAPDGLRVLDDRSLNGVFVNGERIEWRALRDGDVISVGRHRLYLLDQPAQESRVEPPVSSVGE